MEKTYTLFIVDDHQIMIDGLKALLTGDPRFEMLGESTSPAEALEEIIRLQPALVIADISMQGMSGIELTKKIRAACPGTRVLALSMFGDRDNISRMLDAGAGGYILKNTGRQELTDALLEVAAGRMYFTPEVSAEMMKALARPKSKDSDQPLRLTSREIEIVKLIAEELSNAQIGEKLFISERTVETHRKNIFRKTNTKSVAGLIRLAMNERLI